MKTILMLAVVLTACGPAPRFEETCTVDRAARDAALARPLAELEEVARRIRRDEDRIILTRHVGLLKEALIAETGVACESRCVEHCEAAP